MFFSIVLIVFLTPPTRKLSRICIGLDNRYKYIYFYLFVNKGKSIVILYKFR